jgi:hypothetical protein
MSKVLEGFSPVLGEVTKVISEAIDPWNNISDVSSIFCLAADCGQLSSPDIALMSSLQNFQDSTALRLLPAAFAAILTLPQWNQSLYFPALEAFGGNEHCIILTLVRLIEVFSVTSEKTKLGANQEMMRSVSAKFLEMASHVLVMLRTFESEESNKDRPLRAMVFLLELFVRFSPTVNRGTLENYLPYALIHDCQVDIAMGKTCFNDAFTEAFDMETKR